MFISQASFEGEKVIEYKIITKLKQTIKETIDVEGLISTDYWLKENKDRVEYVFITKWKSKDHFIKWITREEHVEEHKQRNKQKKHGLQEEVTIKKTLRQYESVDISPF
ncbi:antibiotic biosynthesis monooxygenase [Peribacillus sp. SI8-4]|uniref:antibiotic biosynthesis monooxygenase n=1 Tax=Peribacillus sp. SI8-4 TaxID=3048009 RepID=UPI0025551C05|nr:antibiotic biosynthesis monooxygenase [Peribacillus sp. SI8-4]